MNKRPKRPKTNDEVIELMRDGRKIDAAVRRAVREARKSGRARVSKR